MRYRRKEIGCEIKYSKLDSRALEYIKAAEKEERNKDVSDAEISEYKQEYSDRENIKIQL